MREPNKKKKMLGATVPPIMQLSVKWLVLPVIE